MNYDFRFLNDKIKQARVLVLSLFFILFSVFSFAQQMTSSIDSTSIKIGAQITYKVQVETDTTNVVVFPEGQTFLPLEVIESYAIDTTRENAKYKLIKKYGLTQFDSGAYTIPRQKIVIGTKVFQTDSLQVEVKNIVVDTTKQGLYDIKPIIEVEKTPSQWFKNLLLTLLVLAVVAFLLYWFIWRKKPLTKEEKIALLPPYDRAKIALQNLDKSSYLENAEIKDYYSELTFIIRKYLDEKVYDRALESTTDELINRLNLLKDGNQIDISKDDIKNIETILKRADLVKFAKSAPDIELAKLDRNTIDVEIDQVKEALPEPTEEEKKQDQKYQEELEKKQKRKNIIITIVTIVALCIATFVGFGLKYGFGYVKDTILGHESKELLEGNWVTSDYGFPAITITTPKVLKRDNPPVPEEIKAQLQMSVFSFGTVSEPLSVKLSTLKVNQQEGQEKIDLYQISEKAIQELEKQGVENMLVKNEKFVTPNNAEGLKTYGTASLPVAGTENYYDGEYILLHFTSQNVIQEIAITYRKGDVYAKEIAERIVNSVELIKEEIAKKEQEEK
ncbi:BatD family protein [Lacinutrix sp. C3R15]|uniref:BatD family protein n=1 Tax=Flavobacteriaceae TaxID=49546 RepID=UPI001C099153|nr:MULTISPECIES: BatD family protein [Flavobacteriaceae]MBU2940978.1 BatD family protein [Lacinutrix sp. C3R15]MDO6624297.1 BatD family protein [Oceanihabitans sp. 1_MG-2023]